MDGCGLYRLEFQKRRFHGRDLDTIAADCERQWRQADGGDLDYTIPVPKWQFLQYLFPLLEYLWGSDLSGLNAQFPADLPYLRDVGFWASKRSDQSAQSPF